MNRIADRKLEIILGKGKNKPTDEEREQAYNTIKKEAASNNWTIEATRERWLVEEGIWAFYVWYKPQPGAKQ